MIYIVTFDTVKNHVNRSWVYHVQAKNAKEAVDIARQKWSLIEHQFHIRATRSRSALDTLHVVSSRNRHYHGQECMDKFIVI